MWIGDVCRGPDGARSQELLVRIRCVSMQHVVERAHARGKWFAGLTHSDCDSQEEKLADKHPSCFTGTMTAPFDALSRATCRDGERLYPFLRMHPRHVRRSASMASASRAVASVGKESWALLVVTAALPVVLAVRTASLRVAL